MSIGNVSIIIQFIIAHQLHEKQIENHDDIQRLI